MEFKYSICSMTCLEFSLYERLMSLVVTQGLSNRRQREHVLFGESRMHLRRSFRHSIKVKIIAST
jgi:hypothetical protein